MVPVFVASGKTLFSFPFTLVSRKAQLVGSIYILYLIVTSRNVFVVSQLTM